MPCSFALVVSDTSQFHALPWLKDITSKISHRNLNHCHGTLSFTKQYFTYRRHCKGTNSFTISNSLSSSHHVIWPFNVSAGEPTQLTLPLGPSSAKYAAERRSSSGRADLCRYATVSGASGRNKQRRGTLLWTPSSVYARAWTSSHSWRSTHACGFTERIWPGASPRTAQRTVPSPGNLASISPRSARRSIFTSWTRARC